MLTKLQKIFIYWGLIECNRIAQKSAKPGFNFIKSIFGPLQCCMFQVEMMPGNDGSDEEFWFLPESADLEHITMLQVYIESLWLR